MDKKAVRELLELIKTDIGESTALVSYTNDLEGAEALKAEMLALEGIDEVLVMPLGPGYFCPRRSECLDRICHRKRKSQIIFQIRLTFILEF